MQITLTPVWGRGTLVSAKADKSVQIAKTCTKMENLQVNICKTSPSWCVFIFIKELIPFSSIWVIPYKPNHWYARLLKVRSILSSKEEQVYRKQIAPEKEYIFIRESEKILNYMINAKQDSSVRKNDSYSVILIRISGVPSECTAEILVLKPSTRKRAQKSFNSH
jgi:hypothetical protein